MKRLRTVGASCLLLAGALRASAQSPVDVRHASIEDLMQVEITSASRKEQRVSDTPAAVFVLTREDIRRSGQTTLMGLLRLVPGVQVARINTTSFAISVRGFNGLYANKLLVMIDGRTIFNPLFGGVFWEFEDVMFDDVERVEVIRGPGGAVWGANAVNGVVNVITRKAADTQGLAGAVRAAASGAGETSLRYGGTRGAANYRVFTQYSTIAEIGHAHDPIETGGHLVSGGLRIDWPTVTIDASLKRGSRAGMWLDLEQLPRQVPLADRSTSEGGHILARWTRALSPSATIRVQSFFDAADRHEPVGDYDRRTGDIDVEWHTSAGARHDVVAGAGYRSIHERFIGTETYTLTPDGQHTQLLSAFAQDEFAAHARVKLTAGAKVEHASEAGFSVQPTARIMWTVVPGAQHAWAAVSRAIRTASMLERGVDLTFPYPIPGVNIPTFNHLRGNPAFGDETLTDLEAGYRIGIEGSAGLDITAFAGRYDHLRTTEPIGPASPAPLLLPPTRIVTEVQFQNLLRADTRGLEVAGRWRPMPFWRVDGSVSLFGLTPHAPASRDPGAATYDGRAPSHQWQIHSAVNKGRAEADVRFFRTGPLREMTIPAYSRIDARLEWKLTPRLAGSVIGRNLSEAAHLEFSGTGEQTLTLPNPRQVVGELRWRF